MSSEEHLCSRGACKARFVRNFYRIWNNPTTEKGYRDYCVPCGRKIIEFNQMEPDWKLEYKILSVRMEG